MPLLRTLPRASYTCLRDVQHREHSASMSVRTKWLNGWPLLGRTVLVGSGVHCAGCGKDFGMTCVAIPEGYVAPEKLPDWPFDEDNCPVHWQPEDARGPTLSERLAAFKAAKARS